MWRITAPDEGSHQTNDPTQQGKPPATEDGLRESDNLHLVLRAPRRQESPQVGAGVAGCRLGRDPRAGCIGWGEARGGDRDGLALLEAAEHLDVAPEGAAEL